MGKLLLIDTSGKQSLLGIARDGLLLQQALHPDTRSQSAVINTLIGQLCTDTGISLKELDAIAVCSGPGSYTGLRISMAAAKGIAWALEKPLILQNKLELLAGQLLQQFPGTTTAGMVITARPGEYFYAVYDSELREIAAPRHTEEQDMHTQIAATEACWAGDEEAVAALGGSLHTITDIDLNSWAQLAETKWQQQQFADIASAQPFYMKEVFIHTRKKEA